MNVEPHLLTGPPPETPPDDPYPFGFPPPVTGSVIVHPEPAEYADWTPARAPLRRDESKAWTLTIADDRDGRLSPPAAAWLAARCAELGGDAVRVRFQVNVKTGEMLLRPSIEPEAIKVRSHRGGPAIRFYVIRLLRAGAVKKGQVIKLRVVDGRLLLVGVKVPV